MQKFSIESPQNSKPLNEFTQNSDKIKRNHPCPCKSGKKFKKCCKSLSRVK